MIENARRAALNRTVSLVHCHRNTDASSGRAVPGLDRPADEVALDLVAPGLAQIFELNATSTSSTTRSARTRKSSPASRAPAALSAWTRCAGQTRSDQAGACSLEFAASAQRTRRPLSASKTNVRDGVSEMPMRSPCLPANCLGAFTAMKSFSALTVTSVWSPISSLA